MLISKNKTSSFVIIIAIIAIMIPNLFNYSSNASLVENSKIPVSGKAQIDEMEFSHPKEFFLYRNLISVVDSNGIHVIDYSVPSAIELISSLSYKNHFEQVVQYRSFIITHNNQSLYIFDFANFTNPQLKFEISVGNIKNLILYDNNLIFISNSSIITYEISNETLVLKNIFEVSGIKQFSIHQEKVWILNEEGLSENSISILFSPNENCIKIYPQLKNFDKFQIYQNIISVSLKNIIEIYQYEENSNSITLKDKVNILKLKMWAINDNLLYTIGSTYLRALEWNNTEYDEIGMIEWSNSLLSIKINTDIAFILSEIKLVLVDIADPVLPHILEQYDNSEILDFCSISRTYYALNQNHSISIINSNLKVKSTYNSEILSNISQIIPLGNQLFIGYEPNLNNSEFNSSIILFGLNSSISSISTLKECYFNQSITNIVIKSNFLYICFESELQIYDLNDQCKLNSTTSLDFNFNCSFLEVDGNNFLVFGENHSLYHFSSRNNVIELQNIFDIDEDIISAQFYGDILVCASKQHIFGFSFKENRLETLFKYGTFTEINQIAIEGNYIYVSDRSFGVYCLDFRKIDFPITLHIFDSPSISLRMIVQQDCVTIQDQNTGILEIKFFQNGNDDVDQDDITWIEEIWQEGTNPARPDFWNGTDFDILVIIFGFSGLLAVVIGVIWIRFNAKIYENPLQKYHI